MFKLKKIISNTEINNRITTIDESYMSCNLGSSHIIYYVIQWLNKEFEDKDIPSGTVLNQFLLFALVCPLNKYRELLHFTIQLVGDTEDKRRLAEKLIDEFIIT